MATSLLRIAILEADIPIGNTRKKYGSYGAVFTDLLHQAADAANIPRSNLTITGWDVINSENAPEGELEDMRGDWSWKRRKGYPRLEDVDAVLITGSRYNAFDHDPWVVRLVDFVKDILSEARVKIIGVCYGHQIIGRALGAEVGRSARDSWELSVCQHLQTETAQEFFGGKSNLKIFQMHRDLIYHYPPGVEKLGSSDACEVQGMYLPKKMISVQGHPEFTPEIVAEILENRHEKGIFNEDIYEEAKQRLYDPQDGIVVAQGFLKFLLNPSPMVAEANSA